MKFIRCYFINRALRHIVIICVLLISIFYISEAGNTQVFSRPDSGYQKIEKGWKLKWGDSPIDSKGHYHWLSDEYENSEWEDVNDAPLVFEKNQDFLWLRTRLPNIHWRDPILFFDDVHVLFEVYLGDSLLYKSGELVSSPLNKYELMKEHSVELDRGYSGKILSLRIFSDDPRIIGVHRGVIIGSHAGILHYYFKRSSDQFVLGFIFIFVGLFSVFVFLRRRKQKVYYTLSFGAFSICFGLFGISSSEFTVYFIQAPKFWYFALGIPLYLFPAFLYIFMEQTIGFEYKSIIKKLWQAHLFTAVMLVSLDILDIYSFREVINVFLVLSALAITVSIGVVYKVARKGSVEAKIMGIGFAVFGVFAFRDIMGELGTIEIEKPYMFWGVLLFMLILAYIIERRLADAHDKLMQYSEELEFKVEERTKDLRLKNSELESTMQELKAAQNQLIMQEKMASLGNLVAGVAHEINTPVGAVSSAADVSERAIGRLTNAIDSAREIDEIRMDPQFKNTMKILKENNEVTLTAGERIVKIVQSLKNFARLDEAEYQTVNVHEGLESTLTLIAHEIKNRIEIIREYGDIPEIDCYPNQLNQVFMNLLVNSSHAIEDKGAITIRTHSEGEKVYIEIIDTGKGIPRDKIDKVFDPGFTTKGVGVGTGLGLSISYNIIKEHKGEITVKSEEGKETTFLIVLPVTKK